MHRAMEAVDSSSIFDEDIVHHGAGFDSDEKDSASQPPTKIPPATMVLAAEAVCPREDAVLYNNPKLEKNRVQIMKKMLCWYPKAARTPFSNGRMPLIKAIAHGGTWHPMGYQCVGGDLSDDNVGVLQLLWGYAPEQIMEIDPVTKLYPFMLAAATPTRRNRNGNTCERDVTNTTFCLLRKDPQLVAGALSE
mmetsp:Transcript_44587/g.94877  ORF Transcript_44587/g.94877 Transcript_44587/m.94877 type:complete len:192 (-) Transcript_44587:283-858(-)